VRKFEELRERKITVLFVSHDLGLVKQLSHRAILLVGGRIHAQGEPNQVINQYIGLVLEKQRAETAPRGKLAAGCPAMAISQAKCWMCSTGRARGAAAGRIERRSAARARAVRFS